MVKCTSKHPNKACVGAPLLQRPLALPLLLLLLLLVVVVVVVVVVVLLLSTPSQPVLLVNLASQPVLVPQQLLLVLLQLLLLQLVEVGVSSPLRLWSWLAQRPDSCSSCQGHTSHSSVSSSTWTRSGRCSHTAARSTPARCWVRYASRLSIGSFCAQGCCSQQEEASSRAAFQMT
jgi:hypothetical protein